MKKRIILTMLITIWIMMISSECVYAVTGLSVAESQILEKLKGGVVIDGEVCTIPVSYLNQLEMELIKNKKDITEQQAKIVLSKIEEVLEIIQTEGLKELSDMNNTEAILRLLTIIDEAASAANYTVSINLTKMSVNIINPEGKMIFVASNTINQTGQNMDGLVVACASILFILFTYLLLIFGSRLYIITQIRMNDGSNSEKSKGISYEE